MNHKTRPVQENISRVTARVCTLLERYGMGVLHGLDAERAHTLAMGWLKWAPSMAPAFADPCLRQRYMGLDFANPVGLAAGFDKDGEALGPLLARGFGFVEAGTVTPRAQTGNPRPRLFRLKDDGAIINRMGFNNAGYGEALKNLRRRRPVRHEAGPPGVIVGINIGANRDSINRIDDYRAGIDTFAAIADYITVNISSPNTPALRELQESDALQALLTDISAARNARQEKTAVRCPLLLKIAPDLHDDQLRNIVSLVQTHGVDGLIVSNTTLARDGLTEGAPHVTQEGGLSGRPVFNRATQVLARVRQLAGPELVLIGVGGIDGGEAALAKIEAGANLLQLYTALIYKGFDLIDEINRFLAARVHAQGVASVADLVGGNTDEWARAYQRRR